MESFGTQEKPFSPSEKNKIKNFLKSDGHVPAKIVEQVVSAESESQYFERLGFFTGALVGSAFFFAPVIRQQPIFRRAILAALPFWYINNWGKVTQEELEWGKAFQKFQVYHGQNYKVLI